jgi:hypothetical protein
VAPESDNRYYFAKPKKDGKTGGLVRNKSGSPLRRRAGRNWAAVSERMVRRRRAEPAALARSPAQLGCSLAVLLALPGSSRSAGPALAARSSSACGDAPAPPLDSFMTKTTPLALIGSRASTQGVGGAATHLPRTQEG